MELRLIKETESPFFVIKRAVGSENPSLVFAEFSQNSRYYTKEALQRGEEARGISEEM